MLSYLTVCHPTTHRPLLLIRSGVKRKDLVHLAFEEIKDFMLLRKLSTWLPALKQLHELVAELIITPLDEDPLRRDLIDAIEKIRRDWSGLNLRSIPAVVVNIKKVFAKFDPRQLDFIAALSSSPKLIRWLLDQKSTESFNSMLQVLSGLATYIVP